MVDNVAITPGVGANIATDDVAGVQYQRTKVNFGVDGSATDVSTTNPLPVSLANTGANATAIKVDNSAVTQPASIADGSHITFGAKADAKSAATDTTAISAMSVWKQISASVQAIATSIAGTLTVATHAVTQSGTWNVTVNSAIAAGTNLLGKVGLDQTTPGTTNAVAIGQIGSTTVDSNSGVKSAGTLRVVLATDQPQLTNKLLVTPDANSAVNVAQINGTTPLMGNGTTGTGSPRVTIASDNTVLPAVGAGATASAVPANAAYQGLNAATSLPSAATAGNLTGAMSDKFGRQVNILGTIRDLVGTQTTTISASTSETTIATAVASTFLDLVLLVISNTSSATNTRIDFRDTTAGSVLFSLQSNGGQPPIGFATSRPIPQTSVNTNWTAQCATSTTDIRVYAVFEKNR